MPEGHKTHRLAIDHSEWFCGRSLRVSSPQGRFSSDAAKVDRQVLIGVEAVGKHLFYQFENTAFIHVHLGRYGSFRISPVPPPPPRGLVRMRMVSDAMTLDLNGPTQCRVIDPVGRSQVLERLGPDPLAGGSASEVWDRVSESKQPIGAVLLDQSVIAGVGNIFRAEALFEVGMNPNLRGNELDRKSFDRLWRVLTRMMRTGVKFDHIIAVTAKEAGKPLQKLDKHERLRIYGKTICPYCGGPIAIVKMAARKLYVCPECQA